MWLCSLSSTEAAAEPVILAQLLFSVKQPPSVPAASLASRLDIFCWCGNPDSTLGKKWAEAEQIAGKCFWKITGQFQWIVAVSITAPYPPDFQSFPAVSISVPPPPDALTHTFPSLQRNSLAVPDKPLFSSTRSLGFLLLAYNLRWPSFPVKWALNWCQPGGLGCHAHAWSATHSCTY